MLLKGLETKGGKERGLLLLLLIRELGEGTGLELHLGSLRKRDPSQLAEGEMFEGNVILDPDAKIGANCKIGPNVSIGKGCEIGDGVRIRDAVLLHRVVVRPPALSFLPSFLAVSLPGCVITWRKWQWKDLFPPHLAHTNRFV